MVYPAFLPLLPLMRTLRLSVVDWTDAPTDLNGLVRFAERRNLVSARVPSHFKRSPTTRIPFWTRQCGTNGGEMSKWQVGEVAPLDGKAAVSGYEICGPTYLQSKTRSLFVGVCFTLHKWYIFTQQLPVLRVLLCDTAICTVKLHVNTLSQQR